MPFGGVSIAFPRDGFASSRIEAPVVGLITEECLESFEEEPCAFVLFY